MNGVLSKDSKKSQKKYLRILKGKKYPKMDIWVAGKSNLLFTRGSGT